MLDGKPPKKIIVVPQRIVNVVAKFRIAARLTAVVALGALTAGCFQPMYAAKTADGSSALREKLASVEVPPLEYPNAPPQARLGIEIRNALMFKM